MPNEIQRCILLFAIYKSTWGLLEIDHNIIAGRVTGGADADVNSAPFIVSFQVEGQHYCAGSIINKNWVLTAAHCLKTRELVKETILLAGIINVDGKAVSAQKRSINHYLVNDLYTGDTSPYDIGLVYTRTAFIWSTAVREIALPSRDYTASGKAVLYGWGSTSTTYVPKFPSILQVATVPIIPLKACELAMGSKGIYVHDTNMCTGPLNGNVGICSADSGGPLIQNINQKAFLIGVVSWGKTPCGQINSPSVYVKVSSVLSWIQNNQVLPK